ncbi:thiol reductant ABC exporter subunit CydC [Nocardia zapadnayensis]|uniref:thiol reductant ABC exporter subunit CydC n=1 Tax=Nocardia rhamnosiphila TaxID=426716 RepID=UPI002246E761|nr:thiol reductant ABC exporter subunit CydC [Nocardia zapadnayensis]MCX0269773.1 thiol reductant ABC exporter subunit CydC [Nocardia zapadnayensis]
MWDLLEVSRRRLAFATGWGVLALGSALGLAALAAWLIARAWQMPPVLDLTVAVVAVRALGISRGVCRYLERLATHDVALRSMTAARTSVYRALARAPLWLTRRAVIPAIAAGGPTAPTAPGGPGVPGRLRRGDVLVRVGTDIDDLGAVVVRTFVPIAVALVLAVAAVGLLACISPPAAGVLAAALAFSGIVAPWLSARAAAAAERSARADRAEFAAHALTVLDHAAELRVAGRLESALDTAAAANRRALAAEDRAAGRNAWAAAAIPLATGVTVLAALLIGIIVYGPGGGTPGAMTPMALAVLVLLPLSAFEATGPLPAAAQTLTVARAALHRLRAVSPDHRPEPLEKDDEPAADPTGGAPRITGTRKRFGTGGYPHPFPYADSRADGVVIGWVGDGQWQIPERPQASRVVVVGPSGAGKTTLLMAWAGLFDDPDDQVRFFAEDAHLFGTSVLENLRVARGDLDAATAERALRTVGLGDWLGGLPDGVHTDLPGGAAAVSGGQRRRILLARALVSPARALLLDEPTEHLDAVAGAQLLRDLLDIDSGLVAADRDVVVVTHQLPAGHRAGLVITVDESGQVRAAFADGKVTRYALDEIPLPTTTGSG